MSNPGGSGWDSTKLSLQSIIFGGGIPTWGCWPLRNDQTRRRTTPGSAILDILRDAAEVRIDQPHSDNIVTRHPKYAARRVWRRKSAGAGARACAA
jgi:hypothetical protein